MEVRGWLAIVAEADQTQKLYSSIEVGICPCHVARAEVGLLEGVEIQQQECANEWVAEHTIDASNHDATLVRGVHQLGDLPLEYTGTARSIARTAWEGRVRQLVTPHGPLTKAGQEQCS